MTTTVGSDTVNVQLHVYDDLCKLLTGGYSGIIINCQDICWTSRIPKGGIAEHEGPRLCHIFSTPIRWTRLLLGRELRWSLLTTGLLFFSTGGGV